MTATLTISLSEDILAALKANKTITIRLGGGSNAGRRPRDKSEPRAGSLPARTIEWAQIRGKPFGTKEVIRKLKLSRAHASMLLSRLASGPFPIERVKRGEYAFRG